MRYGLILGFLLATAPAAWAQSPAVAPVRPQAPRPELRAVRLADDERLALDGRLDESAWTRAVPATHFIQQDPDNGKPASVPASPSAIMLTQLPGISLAIFFRLSGT